MLSIICMLLEMLVWVTPVSLFLWMIGPLTARRMCLCCPASTCCIDASLVCDRLRSICVRFGFVVFHLSVNLVCFHCSCVCVCVCVDACCWWDSSNVLHTRLKRQVSVACECRTLCMETLTWCLSFHCCLALLTVACWLRAMRFVILAFIVAVFIHLWKVKCVVIVGGRRSNFALHPTEGACWIFWNLP